MLMVYLIGYLVSTLLSVILEGLTICNSRYCIFYKFIQLILFILPLETIFWFRHFASTGPTRNGKEISWPASSE